MEQLSKSFISQTEGECLWSWQKLTEAVNVNLEFVLLKGSVQSYVSSGMCWQ